MYACNGILFNHESPRRGETFVTRKITRGLWIDAGLEECLFMGNLDALRDWGHARDYVEMQGDAAAENARRFCDRHWLPETVRTSLNLRKRTWLGTN